VKADVQALVALLSNGQADMVLFDGIYADVINTLGSGRWHTTATPLTFVNRQSLVNLPASLLDILAVIYDDTVLSDLELRELESLNRAWRNQLGNPVAYTRQSETAKTIEVFPVPAQVPVPIIPVHGLPTGEDYQPGNGICIYSENRTDALAYLTIPVALKVLAREYMRESDHVDFAFAKLCEQACDLLLALMA